MFFRIVEIEICFVYDEPIRRGKHCFTGKNMIKIIIVEDQEKWRLQIEKHLKMYSQEKNVLFDVTYFDNGESFLSQYSSDIDLIFMDIGLPNKNGIDISREIRKKNDNVCIVFLTELSQFAIQGYEVNAYDYLVKPMKYDLFVVKMDRILNHLKVTAKKYFTLKDNEGMHRLCYDDILYIESQKHYIYFHCNKETYRMRESLEEIQNEFLTFGFAKINRSIIVNLVKVSDYSHTDVTIKDEVLPLSRVYKSEFLRDLTQFIGKEQ